MAAPLPTADWITRPGSDCAGSWSRRISSIALHLRSPQVATGQHVQERHEGHDRTHRPGELAEAAQIAPTEQIDPDQDHRQRVDEAQQKLDDLLHGRLLCPCSSRASVTQLNECGGKTSSTFVPWTASG